MVAKGFPFLVTIARRSDGELIFSKFVGPQSRHPRNSEFEDLCAQMLNSKSMKSLPEKIVKVDDMSIYISYRVEEFLVPDGGLVFFIFTPKSYNKSELRKLMKELVERFKSGTADAELDDEKLLKGGPNFLSKKSQVRDPLMAAVDKFGEGVAVTDKILAQLDKNKALMSKNIDEIMARNEQLEDTLAMSEELVDQTSAFADKANKIKMAMMMKNLKMLVCLICLCGGLIALLLYQMGVFDSSE